MKIIDRLIGVVAPFECLVCTKEGTLICGECIWRLKTVPSRCYKCYKFTESFKTCSKCRKSSALSQVFVSTTYESLAKEVIWRLKYKSAKSAAREMGELMGDILPFSHTFMLVPVPTTTQRARRRGYDQAKLVAKAISYKTGYIYRDCLSRHGAKHQVGSGRSVRKKQLEGVFRVKNLNSVQNKDVLLVDDVLTTGSTLEAAARTIKKAGANSVCAIVFAQSE